MSQFLKKTEFGHNLLWEKWSINPSMVLATAQITLQGVRPKKIGRLTLSVVHIIVSSFFPAPRGGQPFQHTLHPAEPILRCMAGGMVHAKLGGANRNPLEPTVRRPAACAVPVTCGGAAGFRVARWACATAAQRRQPRPAAAPSPLRQASFFFRRLYKASKNDQKIKIKKKGKND